MQENISFQESIAILDSLNIPSLGSEKVIFSNSLHRVLSQDILAPHPMPKHATSAMDGYAFCASDLQKLQTSGLRLNAVNKAGESQVFTCPSQECIKTFTGARMPTNCEMLVLVEHTREEGGMIFLNPDAPIPKPHQWIRQAGENYKEGEILLKQGTRITPFEIGLLAELNCVFVNVCRRPKVAILSGGDEVVEVGEKMIENGVRSVNNHLLKAICDMMGVEAILYPLLKDSHHEIYTQVLQALHHCDILVTTGGASKGDFDYTQEVLKELCEMRFKGVRIKPGKPVGFGIYQNKTFVFGLPGFPNSCAVTFMLFVSRILKAMLGMRNEAPILKARLDEDLKRSDGRMEFRICDLKIENGEFVVGFWNKKGSQSSIINNFCNQSALLILEENGEDLQKGQKVEIIPLGTLIQL